jgi:hypothetical protein
MNGKINIEGGLEIQRRDKYKKQFCMYDNPPGDVPHCLCGDWCPQFGEVVDNKKGTWITICQNKTLEFDTLEDER